MIVSKEDDRKKKLKGKSKKEDSDSELETDVVDSSSDEVDRKRKKLKIKAGLQRKRSGSDSSNSSSINTTKVKRLISKLEKKVKNKNLTRRVSQRKVRKNDKEDQERRILRGECPEKRPTPIEVRMVCCVQVRILHVELGYWMLGVPVGGYSLFDLDEREADHEFVKLWLVAAKEIDFLFKVNFITLFTNTMGKADGLKGQICLDVVRRLREDSTEAEVQDAEGFIGSSEISKKELAAICSERVLLENLMRKTSSEYPGNGKFVELQEKYVQVFRDPISFDVDVDARNDGNGDDDGDDDNDNDSDGNRDIAIVTKLEAKTMEEVLQDSYSSWVTMPLHGLQRSNLLLPCPVVKQST
ncbi:hypothetical protein Tco_1547999 [Tanacetum coccineum]